jgi:CheY-like chemotaxis protein
MRLLIVDNDEQESAAFAHLVKALGHEVVCTWSGRDALVHLASGRFNLLWVDDYVADMYVGEFIDGASRSPNRLQIVLLRGLEMRPITECKSLGQCQVIDKTQVSHLLQTLSHITIVQ